MFPKFFGWGYPCMLRYPLPLELTSGVRMWNYRYAPHPDLGLGYLLPPPTPPPPLDLAPDRYPPPDLTPDLEPDSYPLWTDRNTENITFPHSRVGGNKSYYHAHINHTQNSWTLVQQKNYFYSDQTHLARERAKADADFYKAQKQAEANTVRNGWSSH